MISDYFRFAYEGIKKRKLRSYLTMIGIFIGIAAVVSLISLGQGLQSAIEDQFQKLGGDKLIITPAGGFLGVGSANQLTKKDLEVVRKTEGVDIAAEMYFSYANIQFKDQSKNTVVIGLPTDASAEIIQSMQGFEAEEGRNLKNGDKYKVIIGWRLWAGTDFFDKSVSLRDKIIISGQDFEVVGLVKRIGNPQDDAQVYVPIDTARDIFNDPENIPYIFAQVTKGYTPEEVAGNVKKELRRSRNEKEDEETFQVQTFENLMSSFNTILGIVQAVLIGIAAISLLVGGIGIMNTMYMAVLERTKEIGVMKAVGAKNSHILQIFLIESGIYGLLGGAVGILIGGGIAKLAELIAASVLGSSLLKAQLSPSLIIGALTFSFLIGMLSGIAPAFQASRLRPVDALRYE